MPLPAIQNVPFLPKCQEPIAIDISTTQTTNGNGENTEHKEQEVRECQSHILNRKNIELEAPPSEFQPSQKEFSSQDNLGWHQAKFRHLSAA
ncbi:FAR1-related protein [Sesbania bispinosa]|nr:FAR1-related protein [Sesbania bispinosa]